MRSGAANRIPLTTAAPTASPLAYGFRHDQALSNLNRLRFASAGKSLEPIARQFLDTPAKLFEQGSRPGSCVACNFKLEPFVSRSFYDHQCPFCGRLKNFPVCFYPAAFCRFLPEKHRLDNGRRSQSGLRRLTAKIGAGDEARTRDVHLGKVVLYQ